MMAVVSFAYARYLQSPEWRRKRQERLNFDNRKCVRCSETRQLEVHHLTYDRLGSEDLDDLITLCRSCHAREHGRDPELPGEMPAGFYEALWQEKQYREIWQEVVADTARIGDAIDDLMVWLPKGEDDPRREQIRELLSSVMLDVRKRLQERGWGVAS